MAPVPTVLNDGRVVPPFIGLAFRSADLTVFGDGLQTRRFCYVSDLVNVLMKLSESDEVYPVNLAIPTKMSILEFAYHISFTVR